MGRKSEHQLFQELMDRMYGKLELPDDPVQRHLCDAQYFAGLLYIRSKIIKAEDCMAVLQKLEQLKTRNYTAQKKINLLRLKPQDIAERLLENRLLN